MHTEKKIYVELHLAHGKYKPTLLGEPGCAVMKAVAVDIR